MGIYTLYESFNKAQHCCKHTLFKWQFNHVLYKINTINFRRNFSSFYNEFYKSVCFSFTLQNLVVIGTDYTYICKSNYNTITTTAVPYIIILSNKMSTVWEQISTSLRSHNFVCVLFVPALSVDAVNKRRSSWPRAYESWNQCLSLLHFDCKYPYFS